MLHQVKLLLQVVEANDGVDAVPVQQSLLHQLTFDEMALQVLIEQRIKQLLIHDAITELLCELVHWCMTLLGKDLIDERLQLFLIHYIKEKIREFATFLRFLIYFILVI
jgi:hypothetical protein